MQMTAMLRPLLVLFFGLTVCTGLIYPFAITGIGKVAFPNEAAGSLVLLDGRPVGSALIGQSFQEPKYFWGRLSATSPKPYDPTASTGSNFSATNPQLLETVQGRIDALKSADPDNTAPLPVDLVTASASGLDPHISPAAALYQVSRIARVRQLDTVKLRDLVLSQVEHPQWGLFGEARVNVLMLNLALDRAK
jgi:potassium-transporting ATPase KdpC subunit